MGNMEGNTILETLTTSQYSQAISVIEEAILATDLSVHFQNLDSLHSLAEEGAAGLEWCDQGKVSVLSSALMTAADIGASAKPWQYQKKIALKIAEEFWCQGDAERCELSMNPAPLMNRELSHQLPVLQAEFCEVFASQSTEHLDACTQYSASW